MDVIKGLGLDPEKLKYNTKSKLFEYKYGALEVVKCPRVTLESKFINFKYHRFHDNIQNGEYMVENIGGDVKKVDIFTEGLQGELFLHIRSLICGW